MYRDGWACERSSVGADDHASAVHHTRLIPIAEQDDGAPLFSGNGSCGEPVRSRNGWIDRHGVRRAPAQPKPDGLVDEGCRGEDLSVSEAAQKVIGQATGDLASFRQFVNQILANSHRYEVECAVYGTVALIPTGTGGENASWPL